MQPHFSFIHSSDLHLGTMPHTSADLPDRLNSIIRTAVEDAFIRLIDCAILMQPDFIILSGDVFDREGRSIRAATLFNKQCRRINNIPIYIVGGNHDPITAYDDLIGLPTNVKLFGSEHADSIVVKDKNGLSLACITGQSYKYKTESRRLYKNFMPLTNGIFNIGMLHTQLDSKNDRYLPCSKYELTQINDIDYWALGHIHKKEIIRKTMPAIVYPGMIQGTDFGETDDCGALLIKVYNKDKFDIGVIPTSRVIYKRIEINLSDQSSKEITNIDDMIDVTKNALVKICDVKKAFIETNLIEPEIIGYIVRIEFVGCTSIHESIKEEQDEIKGLIRERLNDALNYVEPFLWIDSIIFNTNTYVKVDDGNVLYKEIDDIVKECIDSNNSEIYDCIADNLGDIWDLQSSSEDCSVYKIPIKKEEVLELIKSGRNVLLEMLEKYKV